MKISKSQNQLKRRIGVNLILLIIILVGAKPEFFGFLPVKITVFLSLPVVLLVWSSIILGWLGYPIFKESYLKIMQFQLSQEIQLSIALIVTWIVQTVAVFWPTVFNAGQSLAGYSTFMAFLTLFYLGWCWLQKIVLKPVEGIVIAPSPIDSKAGWLGQQFSALAIASAGVVFFVWFRLVDQPFLIALNYGLAVLIGVSALAFYQSTFLIIASTKKLLTQQGVIFKGGKALEELKNTKAVVFDRSGTLTKGTDRVEDILAARPKELLRLAASLEQNIDHQLARAICNRAKQDRVELFSTSKVEFISGMGVVGWVEGKRVVVGNMALMGKEGVVVGVMQREKNRLEELGNSIVIVGLAHQNERLKPSPGELLGLIVVKDQVSTSAKKLITRLKREAIDSWMVTGESEKTARTLGKELGMSKERIIAQIAPPDRLETIRNLKANLGKKYPDGALVSIISDRQRSVSQAVAVEMMVDQNLNQSTQANQIIISEGLGSIGNLFLNSRMAIKRIKSNFRISYSYNGLMIILTSGILGVMGVNMIISPIFALLLANLANLAVMSNSWVLGRKIIPKHQ